MINQKLTENSPQMVMQVKLPPRHIAMRVLQCVIDNDGHVTS